MSSSTRSKSMEPKMTSEGKYQCEADNKTFKTREEYNKHCSEAHAKTGSKSW
ncbi:MAG TPA: hypothetical protein VK536_05560 [Candidatus Limnocylindrales bacterium]|nr:hypothetical protein [Candidatus Limnocylindrales bacterium]